MLRIENCDTIIFHFNKASLADPTIPPWTIKAKGESYYVQHVTSTASWSTKETPANEHTKGSIRFRRADLEIDDNNCATISAHKEI